MSAGLHRVAAAVAGLLLLLNPSAPRAADERGEPLRVAMGRAAVLRTPEPITRVSLADPDLAEVTLLGPRQLLVTAGDRAGSTNLILWHGEDRAVVRDLEVHPSPDRLAALREDLAALAPGLRVRQRGQGVVLDGEVAGAERLERALARIEQEGLPVTNLARVRGSQQVQLEVKLAEVSRTGLQEMGLGFLLNEDWNVGVLPGGSFTGSLEGVVLRDSLLGRSANAALTGSSTLASPFASAFQIAVQALEDDALGLLSLLTSHSLARVLASPTLVALSGQEASFLVGGEFAVPVSVREGVVSIEFKEFGTLLRFTPTVLGEGRISLRVEPEVSNPDFSLGTASGGVAVPGVRTRRGSTTLLLGDGQTFVMAGLLQETSQSVDDRVPFLGDLPLLGGLFTRKQVQRTESELLIVVTPRLVRPLRPDEVPPLPGEGLRDRVSDVEFFLRNRTPARHPEPVRAGGDEEAAAGLPAMSGRFGFTR